MPWTSFYVKAPDHAEVVEYDGLRLAVPADRGAGPRYYDHLAAQACEALDMLYVAFTRARDELYIFRTGTPGLETRPTLGKVLDKLWERAGLAPPFSLGAPEPATAPGKPGDAAGSSAGAAPGTNTPAPAHIRDGETGTAESFGEAWRPMQWLPRLKIFRNPLSEEPFGAEDRGTLLHLCLERLRCTGAPREDAEAAVTAGLACSEAPVPDDAGFREGLVNALSWFAALPRAAGWLAHGRPEQPLLTAGGEELRVDLLVSEPWGTLVIDYKSGQPHPDHAKQVRRYVENLAGRGNGETRGLLIYLDLRRFRLVTARELSELVPDCEALLPGVVAPASPQNGENHP